MVLTFEKEVVDVYTYIERHSCPFSVTAVHAEQTLLLARHVSQPYFQEQQALHSEFQMVFWISLGLQSDTS